jgi:SpoVK/Ycf46/Vps4 family AAA+-type ATPase
MPTTADDPEFDALLQACAQQPASRVLLATMMAEATRVGGVSRAVAHLQTLSPAGVADEAQRKAIAAFLIQAGEDAEAARWRETSQVVSLAAHRPVAVPEAMAERPLTFGDVGGLEDVKRQIHRRIIAPREKPGLFQRFNRRAGGGVLLYGPPGCGKTMLARATAGEAHTSFIEVGIAEILNKWQGQSEKRLVAAFAEARARKPAILFFDEIEALAARRHYDSDNGKAALVSTFLSTFDGLHAANEGVLVLAATNVPWAVDSAFRRPGRFDRVLFVPPPDKAARLDILRGLIKGKPVAPGIDLDRYATKTVGFSGADLMNLVETAIDLAIEQEMAGQDAPAITRAHLDAALEEVRPTTLEWLSTARNYAKYAAEPGMYDDLLAFLDKHQR